MICDSSADGAGSPGTLYLICGKIAAGKSTLARRLSARAPALLISEDHWTSKLFADDLKTIEDYGRLSARLRAAMEPHVVDILRQGLSVVLDFPANTVKNRDWTRSLITEAQVDHELHWLDIPDAVCKQRLRERNASGEHPFQVSDAEYDQFTRYFAAGAGRRLQCRRSCAVTATRARTDASIPSLRAAAGRAGFSANSCRRG